MLIILGILTFSAVSLGAGLPLKLADFAAPFHHACQNFAPRTSELENYRAIVCGSSLSISTFQDDLRRTGLIHLMVVSGSHVAFLEAALSQFSKRWPLLNYAVMPTLFIFALVNQLEAAVMRALFSLLFRRANDRYRLAWGDVQILVLSGLLALAFCRGRNALLSLCLSWLLGLALLKIRDSRPGTPIRSSLWKNTRAYLLIAPGLLPFSLPHPTSILCNFVFAPVLGLFLFPVSLLSFLIPGLAPLADLLWQLVRDVIRIVASFTPGGLERCAMPLGILLIYIAVLSLSAWWQESKTAC